LDQIQGLKRNFSPIGKNSARGRFACLLQSSRGQLFEIGPKLMFIFHTLPKNIYKSTFLLPSAIFFSETLLFYPVFLLACAVGLSPQKLGSLLVLFL
jgi:hypothetical protein